MVRFGPNDIDDFPPGILFSLIGVWQGRSKHLQEITKKKPESNASRKR